jgi:hypothetical protein
LCEDTGVEYEVECTGANRIQEQMLVTTTSGIQIHITVMNDGECRILD